LNDLQLLELEQATCLEMVAQHRFAREGGPDFGPGPRVSVFGCAEGSVAATRVDVDETTTAAVLELVARAAAGEGGVGAPGWIADLATLIGADAAAVGGGPCFHLPNGLGFDHPARFVAGESAEGAAMLERFARDGMPASLVGAGYKSVDDFWAPCCAAVVDGEVAALCCAARLSELGAEAGLHAFPPFRGQGFGAAVTAAWSRLPSLASRTLFYSTSWSNRSSIAVTRRLGLRRIGWSARVG